MSKANKIKLEEAAELLKERIYSSITLVALIGTLWHNAEHISTKSAFVSIAGTAVALWLAIAIASRMSYQLVHGNVMPKKEIGHMLNTRKALITPAIAPLIFVAISAFTPLSLETGLLLGLISLLVSFVLFSFLAGRRVHTKWYDIALSSLLEIIVAVGVVALKIFVGH